MLSMKKLIKCLMLLPVVALLLANVNDLTFGEKVTFQPQDASAFHYCGGFQSYDTPPYASPSMIGRTYNVCYWAFECEEPLTNWDTYGSPGFDCEPGDPGDLCKITWCNSGCLHGYYCLPNQSAIPTGE